MDPFYTRRFWREWNRLLLGLRHDDQHEVLSNPGGFLWRQLAADAAALAE